ncbi:hypothetical protein V2J09_005277 [Rumex salicifolius]
MSSGSVFKAKPTFSRPDGSSKNSSSSLPAKKIGSSSKQQIVDLKNKSISRTAKPEVKASSSSKASAKAPTTPVKREKKVFSLAGQKYDPPEEREPLRIFYESLSEQIPSSEMAEFWLPGEVERDMVDVRKYDHKLMEHGLLSPERAKRAHEKKQRRQKQLRMGIPIKSPPCPTKPESSIRQQQAAKNGDSKLKKRLTNESDDDDDFILSVKRRKG